MTESHIKQIAIAELDAPTFATTQQYLEIHAPVRKDGVVQVDRVDLEGPEPLAQVYIPVEEEQFHFVLQVDTSQEEVLGIGTESWNRVYFRVTSAHHSLAELSTLTSLASTSSWDREDLRPKGISTYGFSAFKIEPNPEPDEFEDKLAKLLTFLEQDTSGVLKLLDLAAGGINVAMNFHDGNGMLGGMHLHAEIVKRIGNLGLSIDFDLYTEGKPFIS